MANGHEIMGFLHGFFGLGGVLAPVIATAMVTKGGLQWYHYYWVMVSTDSTHVQNVSARSFHTGRRKRPRSYSPNRRLLEINRRLLPRRHPRPLLTRLLRIPHSQQATPPRNRPPTPQRPRRLAVLLPAVDIYRRRDLAGRVDRDIYAARTAGRRLRQRDGCDGLLARLDRREIGAGVCDAADRRALGYCGTTIFLTRTSPLCLDA